MQNKLHTKVNIEILRIIAIVTMIIDHVGVLLLNEGSIPYYCTRIIGRIAYPLFAFFLVQGFVYTKNVVKYCIRLFIFAIITEPVFDYFISEEYVYPGFQNVLFTLLIGLAMLIIINKLNENKNENYLLRSTLIMIPFALAAELLRTDYGAAGIIIIYGLYMFKNDKILTTISTAIGCSLISNRIELFALFALPLIFICDNRKKEKSRGNKHMLRYLFYLVYPVHMIILILIKIFLQ